MKHAAQAVQDLARKLLILEADGSQPLDAGIHATVRVAEKLRVHLGKLVGVSGYEALFGRALALARAESPWLVVVQVKQDGFIDSFVAEASKQDIKEATRGGVVLLAQLLGLLITFIGETLTLRLVSDIWQNALLNDMNTGAEEISS